MQEFCVIKVFVFPNGGRQFTDYDLSVLRPEMFIQIVPNDRIGLGMLCQGLNCKKQVKHVRGRIRPSDCVIIPFSSNRM